MENDLILARSVLQATQQPSTRKARESYDVQTAWEKAARPDDPEALFRDLRKRTVPGLLSHQADVLRSYLTAHTQYADIALRLPTGSGKTLVGLFIAEWRRRRYDERVVYLCPTRQLVNQVAQQASTKYGIDLHAFTGSRANYDARASADWRLPRRSNRTS